MTNDDPETFMFIPMAISLAFGVLFAMRSRCSGAQSVPDARGLLVARGRRSEDHGQAPHNLRAT